MSLSIDQVMDAQVCFGSLKNESHPKNSQYWLGVVSGIVIFDPEIVIKQLESAKAKIKKAKDSGKDVLVVCEKKMYASELETLAAKSWVHYLNYKAPSGFLTNFDTLRKRIASMNKMISFLESENFLSLTKKEQLVYKRKLSKVQRVYKWVQKLSKKPELVVVVDWQMMKGFLDELQKESTDNIVLSSSNLSRRWDEDKVVMSNVLSHKSLDFVLNYILS